MPWLRNLVYLLVLLIAAPKLIYSAIRRGKYRQGFTAKFLGLVPRLSRSANERCVWFHAVSVGEVNMLQPLLQEIEQREPHCQCVISTTTLTGFQLARKKYAPRTVFYCPLDFSWAVKTAIKRIQPDLLVLVELELWPNLIHYGSRQSKVIVINGRLSEKSTRGYRRLGWILKQTIRQLEQISVQNQEYYDRFVQIGATPQQLTITGSIKFDGAQSDRQNEATQKLVTLAGIQESDKIILAGSTQVEEEEVSLEVFQRLHRTYPQLKLIIVPRHPERFEEVAQRIEKSGFHFSRRSEMDQPLPSTMKIILVDAIGELGAWWGTAHIALVGGSLGKRGGQNMIEPAGYGVPISFGPNTRNFRDIVEMLIQQDAARVIHNQDEFQQFVVDCLEKPEFARGLGERAKQLVQKQQGATRRTADILVTLLPH